MESETVANLRRAFEAFVKGDLEAIGKLVDPSLEIEDRILPEADPKERGVEALVANAARVRDVFGEAVWEPREIVDLGGRVLVKVHFEARGRTTDMAMDEDIGQIFTMRKGRAVKLDVYRSWEEARAAAGLED